MILTREVRTGVILTVSHQDRCDHRGGRGGVQSLAGTVLPAQSQTRRNIGTATGDTPLISAPLGTHTCDLQAPYTHTHTHTCDLQAPHTHTPVTSMNLIHTPMTSTPLLHTCGPCEACLSTRRGWLC